MNFEIGETYYDTPYLFADLAELLLLVCNSGRNQLHENDLESLLHGGLSSLDELDEVMELENDRTIPSARRIDIYREKLEDVFSHIGSREKDFQEFYPFNVSGKQIIRGGDLTPKHRVYRFLLACSRLRSFPLGGGIRQTWARHFTQLSKIALAGLVSSHEGADIRIFDARSEDRKNYYKQQLGEALKKLGDDLAVNLVIEKGLPADPKDTGDSGVDLVAVVNFKDVATTNYAILGQCAAQEKNWPEKRLECHPVALSYVFNILFPYPNAMFIPVSYRKASGEWFDNKAATGVLLLDRFRILKLIDWQNRFDEITREEWFRDFEQQFATVNLEW